MRIVSDEGAWTGTATGLGTDDPSRETLGGWLTGGGAYDGLMAYFVSDDEGVFGYITPNGPPPVPAGFPTEPGE